MFRSPVIQDDWIPFLLAVGAVADGDSLEYTHETQGTALLVPYYNIYWYNSSGPSGGHVDVTFAVQIAHHQYDGSDVATTTYSGMLIVRQGDEVIFAPSGSDIAVHCWAWQIPDPRNATS